MRVGAHDATREFSDTFVAAMILKRREHHQFRRCVDVIPAAQQIGRRLDSGDEFIGVHAFEIIGKCLGIRHLPPEMGWSPKSDDVAFLPCDMGVVVFRLRIVLRHAEIVVRACAGPVEKSQRRHAFPLHHRCKIIKRNDFWCNCLQCGMAAGGRQKLRGAAIGGAVHENPPVAPWLSGDPFEAVFAVVPLLQERMPDAFRTARTAHILMDGDEFPSCNILRFSDLFRPTAVKVPQQQDRIFLPLLRHFNGREKLHAVAHGDHFDEQMLRTFRQLNGCLRQ